MLRVIVKNRRERQTERPEEKEEKEEEEEDQKGSKGSKGLYRQTSEFFWTGKSWSPGTAGLE